MVFQSICLASDRLYIFYLKALVWVKSSKIHVAQILVEAELTGIPQ